MTNAKDTWPTNLDASNFARLYTIAGMNHCGGGPSTDQFDMPSPMIARVEQGKAPDSVIATARDASSASPNSDVPASWGTRRTRPLCPYPKVARYTGGSVDSASSFTCFRLNRTARHPRTDRRWFSRMPFLRMRDFAVCALAPLCKFDRPRASPPHDTRARPPRRPPLSPSKAAPSSTPCSPSATLPDRIPAFRAARDRRSDRERGLLPRTG
jgi:hypothetical protein